MSNEEYARIAKWEPSMGTKRGDVRDGWVTADVRWGSWGSIGPEPSKVAEIRLLESESPADALARFGRACETLTERVPFTMGGAKALSDTLRPKPPSNTIHVDLEYPRVEGNPDRVTIELTDVRAADSLTVTYDFDRDGWVVLMDKTEDKGDFMDVVESAVEVGFFPAWNTEG